MIRKKKKGLKSSTLKLLIKKLWGGDIIENENTKLTELIKQAQMTSKKCYPEYIKYIKNKTEEVRKAFHRIKMKGFLNGNIFNFLL